MTDLALCQCDKCPLKGSVQVPGKGTGTNSHYDAVLVGIAPAREEVKEGSPFVGWSGTLLRKALSKLGISDFYLTNTLLCELPEGLSSRDQGLAVACCKDRLFEEVRSKEPKVVVALGNVPLEALTGVDYRIRSVTGRILPGLICPVLPVIHPASLRRRPDEFYDFLEGLRTTPKFLSGAYQQAHIPTTVVVTEENFPEILQRIDNAELVAVDLETTTRGFYPYGQEPDRIRCIAIAIDEKTAYIVPGVSSPYYEPHPDFSQDKRLKGVLNRSNCIFHNGPFDVGFLNQAGYKVKIFFDTFLAHYLMDEREYTHGLKPLAQRYLGAPEWEADIKDYLPHKHSSYDLIPTDKLYEYASHDVIYTFHLSEGGGFRNQVGSQKVYKDLLIPCANMFSDIRHRGFRIDVQYLMDLDGVLERDLDLAREELDKLVGYPVNPFSPQEMATVLYDSLKFPVYRRTGRSTDKRVLANLGGPICEKILECRALGKLKGTYVVGMANFVDTNFRIHPFTKLHGARTGRISTEDPSVMNVTKKGGIKKLYIPEEGHLILDADQGQMEFRCYAVIADDKRLKQIFRDREDPHWIVAQALALRLGMDWDSLSDTEKAELRQRSKSGDFGRLYGRGVESFIREYRLSPKDAAALLATIDSIFPSIKDYNKWVRNEIHTKGYLESYFERRRRFGLVLDSNKHEYYRQGANFLVQSMASDINLFCMLHLWDIKDELGIFPMFPVHDSIVMDIPNKDVIPQIQRELKTFSEGLVGGEMEFMVDLAVGSSWGDTVPWIS